MGEERRILLKEKVLDHGFVELIDVLGSDQDIVNAARTSYDKGTKKISSTKQLIRYLIRHKHSGPIEFGVLVFRIRCPIFVARQWFRHRMASYNEVSLRYSEVVEEFYVPRSEWITSQDRRNRQARTDHEIKNSKEICSKLKLQSENLLKEYHSYIEEGVAREIARINLPLSIYTSFVFKIDLRNLLNFLSLRTDPHAQFEIRQYANIMAKMSEKYFPIVIQAWRDYVKNSISFSASELTVLKNVFEEKFDILHFIEEYLEKNEKTIPLAKLESLELIDKLRKLMGFNTTLDYLGKEKK
ncbi:FAD-dependent thymidylate synthase [Promethearchaeum syntrophicum]|uniref:Flavin-dependent thymidylate synthase n=1 Tax=Promethearchaeum syntrophicum TaxID=2594042 RepID=A0A5B9D7C8_9ARCH|nr:FAD-dependent thymidylate synthase [Candidatus Prometheoarchaeum syntrophicum]QEE14891.1 FAD-dependent thymidylate synthase [Candidatus Prometheoarchaeum syntrophicum]